MDNNKIEPPKKNKIVPPYYWPSNWPGHWHKPPEGSILTIRSGYDGVNEGFLELIKSFGNSYFYFSPVSIEMMREYYLKSGLTPTNKIICAFTSPGCEIHER